MNYKAYHRLRTADSHILEGPIAAGFDTQGNITGWHKLRCEEPFTIWMGGTLDVPLALDKVLSLEQR